MFVRSLMSELIHDGKYFVFKLEEFADWMETHLTPEQSKSMPSSIGDATVIRAQDIFAAPALHAYANAITISIEVLQQESGGFTPTDHLQAIADYFHDRAVQAEQTEFKKIPD